MLAFLNSFGKRCFVQERAGCFSHVLFSLACVSYHQSCIQIKHFWIHWNVSKINPIVKKKMMNQVLLFIICKLLWYFWICVPYPSRCRFFFFHACYWVTGNLNHQFVKQFFIDFRVKSAVSTFWYMKKKTQNPQNSQNIILYSLKHILFLRIQGWSEPCWDRSQEQGRETEKSCPTPLEGLGWEPTFQSASLRPQVGKTLQENKI